ncbi:hypothetical protein PVAP13_2KG168258, partial [Panicum virgatum]
ILRRRKFLEQGYNCAPCHEGVEETFEQLFFNCPTAACRWFSLGIVWRCDKYIRSYTLLIKKDFMQPFFMEIFLIGAWCLWNERNDYIFNNKLTPKPCLLEAGFKAEVIKHLIRIKQSLHHSIICWLEAL